MQNWDLSLSKDDLIQSQFESHFKSHLFNWGFTVQLLGLVELTDNKRLIFKRWVYCEVEVKIPSLAPSLDPFLQNESLEKYLKSVADTSSILIKKY